MIKKFEIFINEGIEDEIAKHTTGHIIPDMEAEKQAMLDIAAEYDRLEDEEGGRENIIELLYNASDFEKEELEEMSPEELIELWNSLEMDDVWADPAGGIHYGDEEDPAAMYENKIMRFELFGH